MVPGVSVFKNLPTPMKFGVSAVICVVVSAGMLFLIPARVRWIVFIGLGVVVLLLFLYWRLLKWMTKRKAAPMENSVIQNTAATPQGVSYAANLARLDDLRKKFEEGIAKFHSAGKSLYNFPWYLIVGEPGSGKTEAIRHCNVGFPPGLQDQFQGAGGTLNMNWWFTDHAVVLDTAGRLMFDEVDTGGSSEWREFLKLLKKYRPLCPVNGVFLVIPADSLIKDTADVIEEKASKIARQFDMIQRTLDVRFPVFVVITKSDLVNGFRDFFDDLDDPQLQHQILGWSNPGQLDDPYNPDFVDQHLTSIQGRLFRRRLALLQEIVSEAGQPGAEQMRSPDTLYAFPQSLAKIVPRMARYLELIFSVGSQWSCKPLFFRGIYFTSSMREGSALDEDLAESLGMSVDALPDGRVWERDRAYFLRDLFLKKVFREKGLVTNATNAKKQHFRRKVAVLLCAAASVVLLLFCTVYAGVCLHGSIGEMKRYFEVPSELIASGVEDAAAKELQVIIKDEGQESYRYGGRAGVPEMPDDVTRSNFSARLAGLADDWEKEGVPWIFAPAAGLAEGIKPEKFASAQAAIYEIGVLRPFFDAAALRMSGQEAGKWTLQEHDIHVLRQFIRLKNKSFSVKTGYKNQLALDPLSYFIFQSDGTSEDDEGFIDANNYNDDKAKLHEPIESIYGGTLSPTFADNDANLLEAIESGIAQFNSYWADPNQARSDSRGFAQVETIEKLVGLFEQFGTAEDNILAMQTRFDFESEKLHLDDRWETVASEWDTSFETLQNAAASIGDLAARLENPRSLTDLWRDVSREAVKDVNDHYRWLVAELDSDDAFLTQIRDQLDDAYDSINNRLASTEFEGRLQAIDASSYAQTREGGSLYELRFRMYKVCNEQFVNNKLLTNEDLSTFEKAAGAFQKVERDIKDADEEIGRLLSTSPDPKAERFQKAARVCRSAIGANRRRQFFSIIGLSLNEEDVKALAQAQTEWDAYLGGYSSLYFDYWLDTEPESEVDGMVEKDLPQRQSRDLVSSVLNKLNNFGATVEAAVEPLERYASSDDKERISQFKENRVKVSTSRKRNEIERHCQKMLDKWRALSEKDLPAKRRLLLGLTPEKFGDYAPFNYDSPAEFVDMYWTKLSLQMLDALSKEVEDRGTESMQGLKYQFGSKFPLEWYSQDNLEETELVEAWASLNDVRLQESFDEGTIGSGEVTGSDDADERLQLLRGLNLGGSDKQWFDGIEKVLRAMPRKADDPYYCRMTLVELSEQQELAKQGNEKMPDLNWFRVIQGSKTGQSRTSSRKNLIGMFGYPDKSSLKIEFFRYPDDTESHTSVEFPGPWAILRMLHKCHDARKRRYVKLEVESDEGLGGVLFLQLEFSKDSEGKNAVELPDPDHWPSLKSER